jgi:predicted ester cyclase
MVRWTYRATHQVEVFGLSPTGKQVRVSGITLYRIPYGKVVEENGVVDNFSLMRQLGVVSAPE